MSSRGSQLANPVNLLLGWPHPSLLPARTMLDSSSDILADKPTAQFALNYAPDEGWQPLRESVADWLTRFYQPKQPILADRICITGGASQNFACLLQTFTDPVYTRAVFMTTPTYHLACRILEDSGFAGKMKAVPEDEQGIDIDFLARKLKQTEEAALADGNLEPGLKPKRSWRKIYKYIIYAVPTFANPSGRIMTLRRREEIVRLARKYDALIVTDDVYDMLQWPAEGTVGVEAGGKTGKVAYLPRIVDVDRHLDEGPGDEYGNAVSNASFSKLIGPGCRTGFAEGTPKLAFGLSQTGSSRSGGCPSQLVASFIDKMIRRGDLDTHIEKELQPVFARRYRLLMEAIEHHLLPLGATTLPPNKDVAGGYFVWLTLPHQLDAAEIARLALEEEDLTVIEGSKFRVWGDDTEGNMKFGHDLRLSFAWEEESLLQEGVERLGRVVQRALSRQ